jgi:hypothetical protein
LSSSLVTAFFVRQMHEARTGLKTRSDEMALLIRSGAISSGTNRHRH